MLLPTLFLIHFDTLYYGGRNIVVRRDGIFCGDAGSSSRPVPLAFVILYADHLAQDVSLVRVISLIEVVSLHREGLR